MPTQPRRCVDPNWPFLIISVFLAALFIITLITLTYLVKVNGVPIVPTEPTSSTTTTTSTNPKGSTYVSTTTPTTSWNNLHYEVTGNPRVTESIQKFNSTTAKDLELAWKSDISSIPAKQPVSDGIYLYGCDTRGYLFKVSVATGAEVWKLSMETITGVPGSKCGSTPLVLSTALYVGDKRSGTLFKIDKKGGELIWKVVLDSHIYASIVQTPIENKGVLYVGVNTLEPHILLSEPNYPCCSFRGSVVSLASGTGTIYWKTEMLPKDDRKLSGLAVIGDSLVLDPMDMILYASTGPLYSASQSTTSACFGENRDPSACTIDGLKVAGNAIVSMNAQTGAVKWSIANHLNATANYTSIASYYNPKRGMEFIQLVPPQTLVAQDNEGNVIVFDRLKTKITHISRGCARLSREVTSLKKDKGVNVDIKYICDTGSFLQLSTIAMNTYNADKKTNDFRLVHKGSWDTIIPIKAMARSHIMSVNDVVVHTAKIDKTMSHITVNEESGGNTLFTTVVSGDTKGCIYIEGRLMCTTDEEIYCYYLRR